MKHLSALVLLALTGCLDHKLPAAPPGEVAPIQGPFIALQSAFADFHTWQRFEPPAKDHLDQTAPRAVYVSQIPTQGTQEFPVGTLIVKVIGESKPPAERLVHAMVKRGGGFNAQGARGWEWFELRINDDDIPVILWRGERPPDGEGYGLPGGVEIEEADCNDCHTSAQNDAVLTPDLLLGADR